jgi:hypothetical protein
MNVQGRLVNDLRDGVFVSSFCEPAQVGLGAIEERVDSKLKRKE